jgi:hypothetical protein
MDDPLQEQEINRDAGWLIFAANCLLFLSCGVVLAIPMSKGGWLLPVLVSWPRFVAFLSVAISLVVVRRWLVGAAPPRREVPAFGPAIDTDAAVREHFDSREAARGPQESARPEQCDVPDGSA